MLQLFEDVSGSGEFHDQFFDASATTIRCSTFRSTTKLVSCFEALGTDLVNAANARCPALIPLTTIKLRDTLEFLQHLAHNPLMKFSSAFFIVLTSFVLAGSATTPADVKADVKVISDKVAILDKSMTQLPMTGATADQLLVFQLPVFYAPLLTAIGYSQ
jgi:hypothetical protein